MSADINVIRTAMQIKYLCEYIHSNMEKITIPFIVFHGKEDLHTDYRKSIELYEKASSKDKSLKLFDNCYHCIILVSG